MPIKREEIIGDCRLILGDNMPLMADMADNEFQLAIVDPPYRDSSKNQPTEIMRKKGGMKKWENKPRQDYFDKLFRVSTDQIIWGGNYFTNCLEPTNNWIVWDKKQFMPTYSRAEMAWCSTENKFTRIFEYRPMGNLSGIHPTEKPTELYKWLLKNYAKPGDHIIDTHGGSMSSVIACIEMGYKITCIEIDEDYFEAGVERVRQHQRQGKLFQPPKQPPKPQGLF